jgi:hypothetical protein
VKPPLDAICTLKRLKGSIPSLCEVAVGVKRFIPSMLAESGHTDTAQRVLFISLFALLCGQFFNARRMFGCGGGRRYSFAGTLRAKTVAALARP